jgi:hypothetical protein
MTIEDRIQALQSGFDNLPNKRLRPDFLTKAQAAEPAQAFARAELKTGRNIPLAMGLSDQD